MHSIKLSVQDNVYEHVMFLLKNLNTKDIEIIEDKVVLNESNNIDFSKYKVKAFQDIQDPLKWQKEIREEWNQGE